MMTEPEMTTESEMMTSGLHSVEVRANFIDADMTFLCSILPSI